MLHPPIHVTHLVTLAQFAQISCVKVQGPPANRVIWQRRFSIFSMSGEGE